MRGARLLHTRATHACWRSIATALAALCATAHCSRLASVILAIAAGHASGSSTCDRRSDRAVSQECKSQWETSGGGGSSWNGSPDFRRRRARSGRASTLMGCGPSPPRRSPADDATSPASKTTSSSSVEPVWQNFLDSEKENRRWNSRFSRRMDGHGGHAVTHNGAA